MINCHLQSIHQPQLYEHMLETMTQDDTGSLLLVTSSEKISLSSKLLQTISPLYRDIIRDVGSDIRAQQVTIIIPDTKAVTVQNLLALVTTGQIASDKGDQLSCCDIVNLASSLNIPLKEKDLSRSATVFGSVGIGCSLPKDVLLCWSFSFFKETFFKFGSICASLHLSESSVPLRPVSVSS